MTPHKDGAYKTPQMEFFPTLPDPAPLDLPSIPIVLPELPVHVSRPDVQMKRSKYDLYTREQIIKMYLQKRKQRSWRKTKYARRKEFADSRPRIGGKFTKLK